MMPRAANKIAMTVQAIPKTMYPVDILFSTCSNLAFICSNLAFNRPNSYCILFNTFSISSSTFKSIYLTVASRFLESNALAALVTSSILILHKVTPNTIPVF